MHPVDPLKNYLSKHDRGIHRLKTNCCCHDISFFLREHDSEFHFRITMIFIKRCRYIWFIVFSCKYAIGIWWMSNIHRCFRWTVTQMPSTLMLVIITYTSYVNWQKNYRCDIWCFSTYKFIIKEQDLLRVCIRPTTCVPHCQGGVCYYATIYNMAAHQRTLVNPEMTSRCYSRKAPTGIDMVHSIPNQETYLSFIQTWILVNMSRVHMALNVW